MKKISFLIIFFSAAVMAEDNKPLVSDSLKIEEVGNLPEKEKFQQEKSTEIQNKQSEDFETPNQVKKQNLRAETSNTKTGKNFTTLSVLKTCATVSINALGFFVLSVVVWSILPTSESPCSMDSINTAVAVSSSIVLGTIIVKDRINTLPENPDNQPPKENIQPAPPKI